MKRCLCLFLAILTVSACKPEARKELGSHVLLQISDRSFNIPRIYIDYPKNQKSIQDSVILEYVLPDYEPQPPHPQERAKRKELILQGRMRGMLLEESSIRPTFNVMVKNFVDSKSYQLVSADVYGLEKFTAEKSEGKYATKPDDMFVERDQNGDVINFLLCSPPNTDRIPACEHRFRNNKLLYKISWHISELPNWRKQRAAAIDFLDNFEVIEE
ncbi:MAG TPA: hypothetical protein EYG18_02855 [Micavibrio sp.]|nr:hypothetical protein [Micavibrio sp.]HIL28186.1 hypothetical protein [Micavibrio sp.]